MGPLSEGHLSGDERALGGGEEGGRYHSNRDADNGYRAQHPRSNGPLGVDDRSPASPAISTNGNENDGDTDRGGRERNRSRTRNGRTASGTLRVCKKCGEPLTGQFVRALNGTYHLDCFKCRVSRDAHPRLISADVWLDRTAERLSLPSSSRSTRRTVVANIHFVRLTTSDDSTSYVTSVGVRYGDLTLRHSNGNTISITLHVPSVRPCLARKTATMSTMARSTVITTIPRSLRSDATVAKRLSSSSSWRYSAMAKTSIGIPNAT